MKRWWRRQRGGVLVEGAIGSSVAILLLMGCCDVGLGMLVGTNMENAASRAAEVFQVQHDPAAALAAAQSAMTPLATKCVSLNAYGWSSLLNVDVRNTSTGTPITSASVTTDSNGKNLVLAVVNLQCSWSWLTPPIRTLAGGSVMFRRSEGMALE